MTDNFDRSIDKSLNEFESALAALKNKVVESKEKMEVIKRNAFSTTQIVVGALLVGGVLYGGIRWYRNRKSSDLLL